MQNTVCLNMIVKNESRIIKRCLDSVKHLIDSWCIVDTGSSDGTQEIIKETLKDIPGKLHESPWVNFGHNRDEAYGLARQWADWILLVDADMQLKDCGLDKTQLNPEAHGYQVLQKNSSLSYYNTRLLNSKSNWRCVGVTHEYYSCDAKNPRIEKLESFYIDDIGDGGSKTDKFERDIRLLTQGLKDEPENARYMFYLAQSYKDTGNFEQAIEWYKKRIAARGWIEECWYSHYMISKCYISLGDLESAEEWAKKGLQFYPKRSEALYELCKEFRSRGNHQKAYEYWKLGHKIPYPKDDLLFISHAVYDHLFDYELTILHYYLFPEDRETGLRKCVEYLQNNHDYFGSVYSNLKFYLPKLSDYATSVHTLAATTPEGFVNSTPCKLILQDGTEIVNVRQVNYQIDKTKGTYHYVSDGSHMSWENTQHRPIVTKNYRLGSGEMKESYSVPIFSSHIIGLEDLRLFERNNKIQFFATTKHLEHSRKNRIATGEYNTTDNMIHVTKVFDSPLNADCEKNWVIFDDNTLIYSWAPLRLYHMDNLVEKSSYKTPAIFNHFRGSSSTGVKFLGLTWFIVHSAIYESPRTYMHYLVALSEQGTPVMYSLPFTFEGEKIEYCLSLNLVEDKFEFHYSTWDNTAKCLRVPTFHFFNKLILCA